MTQITPQIIAMWSGPRNLSTAMMRSFGSRADCAVLDEPFFAPYLKQTGKSHPGRDETLNKHETNQFLVEKKCLKSTPNGEKYYFQKHMPQHILEDFPLGWATKGKHFFLLREPSRVIASYAKGRPDFELDDLGFAKQRAMFSRLEDLTGMPPPVIDSVDILKAPEAMLTKLCAALGIPFDPAMLSWAAGPRPEDGAWAPYWYASVEKSTGFGPPPGPPPAVPERYKDMLEICEADYAALYARRLRA